jgi:hypothetical protein
VDRGDFGRDVARAEALRAAAQGLITVRKASFWLAVAGVSVLANFALEVAADKVPALGLSRFTAYAHKGAN